MIVENFASEIHNVCSIVAKEAPVKGNLSNRLTNEHRIKMISFPDNLILNSEISFDSFPKIARNVSINFLKT